MKAKGETIMGRFLVDIEVINNEDLGLAKKGFLDPAKVRRKTIQGVVDTGATRMVLPLAVVKELGLPIKKKKVRVRYADGRRGIRSEADDVRLQLQGRDGIFTATIEPKRETALIGAIVLEDLDFLVDSSRTRLVPRDPHYVLNEIE